MILPALLIRDPRVPASQRGVGNAAAAVGDAVAETVPLTLNRRKTWRLGIFDCFNAKDAGLRCCCAACCCNIWVWKNAIALVPGLEEGAKLVLQQTVAQEAMRGAAMQAASSGGEGGQGASALANVFLAGNEARTTFSRANVREQLFEVLYGSESRLQETDGRRYIYVSLCPCCATVQVVDAIQTYAKEEHGRVLKYGPITWDCRCCSLVEEDGLPARPLPAPRAPTASVMER